MSSETVSESMDDVDGITPLLELVEEIRRRLWNGIASSAEETHLMHWLNVALVVRGEQWLRFK
jgi:hypothetical protein